MRDDPRLRKLRALAARAGTPGERAAALAAIERVRQSGRPMPVFSEDEPVANRRAAIKQMMRRGPCAWSMRERVAGDDHLPLPRVRRNLN